MKIKTRTGQYIGKTDQKGVTSFKGIRYAKPPVGDLRWKAPVKLDESTEIFEAFDFGASAIQEVDEWEPISCGAQSEDCLTLNIWTKQTEVKKPVMVYFHGGSYKAGGSGDPLYSGYNFARRSDVVIVSANFRVNILGSLYLDEIGGSEYEDSKNLIMLDHIMVLEWVKENIEAFGGDSKNVTIFGESTGGMAVSTLMIIPKAKGLFQKVIAQSGTMNWCKSNDKAKEIANSFMEISEKKDMSELMDMTSDEIREKYLLLNDKYSFGCDAIYCPVVDGNLIPENPMEMLKSGYAKDIKLMIGSTKDELAVYKQIFDDLDEFAKESVELIGEVIPHATDKPMDLLEDYYAIKPDEDIKERKITFSGDVMLWFPSVKVAEIQSDFTDVWMYLFGWESNIEGLGACHVIDMPFVFHNLKEGEEYTGPNAPEKLADVTQDAWVSFATNGNPNHKDLIFWPTYEKNDRNTMFFDEESRIEKDPSREERLLLDNNKW